MSSTLPLGREASRALLGLLVRTFGPNSPLVIGVDETLERRWGKKNVAKGTYRDSVRSAKECFVKASSLRWVCLLRFIPLPGRDAPGRYRDNPRYGIYGEFTWAGTLEEEGEGNTRFILRTRANYGLRLYRALTMSSLLVRGEVFTALKAHYGTKRRAERTGRDPAVG